MWNQKAMGVIALVQAGCRTCGLEGFAEARAACKDAGLHPPHDHGAAELLV